MATDLTHADAHFKFGENWKSFVNVVSEERITEAVKGLQKLFPNDELRGSRFLDIGCGSGLSMLAALRLGSSHVTGIDIDEASVEASRSLLSKFAPDDQWAVSKKSVFELQPDTSMQYDIVHSWGVLHHTGDMWRAVQMASAMVRDRGLLALALYKKTRFCGFWRVEKRIYSSSPAAIQRLIRTLFKTAYFVRKITLGQNPLKYIRDYKAIRGMDWQHDVHDWLGGYPYESANAEEIERTLSRNGFEVVQSFLLPAGRGVFSSGCQEFVAKRISQRT